MEVVLGDSSSAASILEQVNVGLAAVMDGALGTMLMSRGLEPGGCPELFAIERPDVLVEIHGLYLDAGAQVLTTSTFGGSPIRLGAHGLAHRVDEINLRAAELARAVAADRALVAGSCGPCGDLLKPFGAADPDAVRDGFMQQISSLAQGGVDLILIETMTDLREACLAVEAAVRSAPQTPVAACMSFDSTPRGFFTIMGDSLERVARELELAGAAIIGSNCGHGVEKMVELAARLRPLTELPLIIQSNAGLPELQEGRLVYPESPGRLAEGVTEMLEMGVSLVGGCCGTTPEHISAVRMAVDQWAAAKAARGH